MLGSFCGTLLLSSQHCDISLSCHVLFCTCSLVHDKKKILCGVGNFVFIFLPKVCSHPQMKDEHSKNNLLDLSLWHHVMCVVIWPIIDIYDTQFPVLAKHPTTLSLASLRVRSNYVTVINHEAGPLTQ